MTSAYRLLKALLLVLWPPSLWAATSITLDTTLGGISASVWLILAVIATMGGLTSLLHRLKTSEPERMYLYVVSHMLMAWFAGAGAFFLMEMLEVHDLVEVPMIGIAAYSGARFVDVMSERVITSIDKALGKLFS